MILTDDIVRLFYGDPRIAALRRATFGIVAQADDTESLWYGVEVRGELGCAYSVRTLENGDTWLLELYIAPGFAGKRALRIAAKHIVVELGVSHGIVDAENPYFKTWVQYIKRFGFKPVGLVMKREH